MQGDEFDGGPTLATVLISPRCKSVLVCHRKFYPKLGSFYAARAKQDWSCHVHLGKKLPKWLTGGFAKYQANSVLKSDR